VHAAKRAPKGCGAGEEEEEEAEEEMIIFSPIINLFI
jgi:hypothetical protein